tara:strand:+ start:19723 stop:20409 length:687 start_codon:yes stop_codon:yes gene_type:complete
MKYVPKEPPAMSVTADADAMMREFNRAMGVVYNDIDQNNVSDDSVSWQRIASPVNDNTVSTSVLGTPSHGGLGVGRMHLVSQVSGYYHELAPPSSQSSGSTELRPEGYFWEFVSASNNYEDLSLSFSLNVATEITVIGTGQIYRSGSSFSAATRMFDVRLHNNGSSMGIKETVSSRVQDADLPFYVDVRKQLSAGSHTIRIQVRDRSGQVDSGARIKNTSICMFGFCR